MVWKQCTEVSQVTGATGTPPTACEEGVSAHRLPGYFRTTVKARRRSERELREAQRRRSPDGRVRAHRARDSARCRCLVTCVRRQVRDGVLVQRTKDPTHARSAAVRVPHKAGTELLFAPCFCEGVQPEDCSKLGPSRGARGSRVSWQSAISAFDTPISNAETNLSYPRRHPQSAAVLARYQNFKDMEC